MGTKTIPKDGRPKMVHKLELTNGVRKALTKARVTPRKKYFSEKELKKEFLPR